MTRETSIKCTKFFLFPFLRDLSARLSLESKIFSYISSCLKKRTIRQFGPIFFAFEHLRSRLLLRIIDLSRMGFLCFYLLLRNMGFWAYTNVFVEIATRFWPRKKWNYKKRLSNTFFRYEYVQEAEIARNNDNYSLPSTQLESSKAIWEHNTSLPRNTKWGPILGFSVCHPT